MKKKVVVLGNLPLATKIIKLIEKSQSAELVGVIHTGEERKYPSSDGEVCAATYCRVNDIAQLRTSDLNHMEGLSLAISARNNEILKQEFFDLFDIGVVNCHGGYLPDYKGVGGHIFPLLNGEEFTGGTVHWMSQKIDEGDIISRQRVNITSSDTGVSLFKKINDCIAAQIKSVLPDLLNNTIKSFPQKELAVSTRKGRSYFYFQKDISDLYSLPHKSELVEKALVWEL